MASNSFQILPNLSTLLEFNICFFQYRCFSCTRRMVDDPPGGGGAPGGGGTPPGGGGGGGGPPGRGGGGGGAPPGGGGGGGGAPPGKGGGGGTPAESVKSLTGAKTSASSCEVRSVKSKLLTFNGNWRISEGGRAHPNDSSISSAATGSSGGGGSISGSLGT